MNTDFFVKKPVFAIVLNVLIVFLGILSFSNLEIRLYPKVDPTVITVKTDYIGASANDIETFITTPLESYLSGLDGLNYSESSSSKGSSSITLYFKSDYKLSDAMSDVVSKVSAAKYLLPKDSYDPVVSQYDPSSTPLNWLSLTSDKLNLNQLSAYFLDSIQPQLQNLPGLAQAKAFGRRDYAMRFYLDPVKIWAHKFSFNEVINKIKVNNANLPIGNIVTKYNDYNLSLKHQSFNASHFNDIVIRKDKNEEVRVKDVANVEMSSKDLNKSAFYKGTKALFVGLYQSPGANPLLLSKAVKEKILDISKNLRHNVKIHNLWDNSIFIQQSINEVMISIFEASACVILVILLFLGSFRAVLVPSIAIPLSLIGSMSILLYFDFSINSFTLLALVLAIGMVVDDAIVVLENIHRYIEQGLSPLKSALKGAYEIRFAVVAMTITNASVYAPIGFLGGSTGRLFKEFAFTLAGAVIISGFVALTLSPMLCSRFLVVEKGTFAQKIESFFIILGEKYHKVLLKTIYYKKSTIMIFILIIAAIVALFFSIPQELVPQEDTGAVLTFVTGPEDANIKYTEQQTKPINQILSDLPYTNFYGLVNGINGPNTAMAILTLQDWSRRPPLNTIVMQDLFPKMAKFTGIKAFPVNFFSVPGSSSRTPLEVVIKTEGGFDELYLRMQNMINYLKEKAPFLLNPQGSLNISKQGFDVKIDNIAAASLKVNTDKIGQALFYALGEGVIGKFVYNNRSYDLISEIDPEYRKNLEYLNLITVRSNDNKLISLASLIHLSPVTQAASLPHFQNMRAIKFTAIPVPGFPLGVALDIAIDAANKFFPTNNFSYDYSGQTKDFIESSGQMIPLFIYALIFIYLVLSAQYESFIDPIIILVTVPLSTFGALLALKLAGGTLNLYTNIGILTLVGLISKHGILIVDFANKLPSTDKITAVLQAAKIRLRPVLATTAAMILGAIPLIFATGAGMAARYQIGSVIIGGMFFGTLMSLFVVPVVYTMISRRAIN